MPSANTLGAPAVPKVKLPELSLTTGATVGADPEPQSLVHEALTVAPTTGSEASVMSRNVPDNEP